MHSFFEAVDAGAYNKELWAFFTLVLLVVWLVPRWLERRGLRRRQEACARGSAELRFRNALEKSFYVRRTWGLHTPEHNVACTELLAAYDQMRELDPQANLTFEYSCAKTAMRELDTVGSGPM